MAPPVQQSIIADLTQILQLNLQNTGQVRTPDVVMSNGSSLSYHPYKNINQRQRHALNSLHASVVDSDMDMIEGDSDNADVITGGGLAALVNEQREEQKRQQQQNFADDAIVGARSTKSVFTQGQHSQQSSGGGMQPFQIQLPAPIQALTTTTTPPKPVVQQIPAGQLFAPTEVATQLTTSVDYGTLLAQLDAKQRTVEQIAMDDFIQQMTRRQQQQVLSVPVFLLDQPETAPKNPFKGGSVASGSIMDESDNMSTQSVHAPAPIFQEQQQQEIDQFLQYNAFAVTQQLLADQEEEGKDGENQSDINSDDFKTAANFTNRTRMTSKTMKTTGNTTYRSFAQNNATVASVAQSQGKSGLTLLGYLGQTATSFIKLLKGKTDSIPEENENDDEDGLMGKMPTNKLEANVRHRRQVLNQANKDFLAYKAQLNAEEGKGPIDEKEETKAFLEQQLTLAKMNPDELADQAERLADKTYAKEIKQIHELADKESVEAFGQYDQAQKSLIEQVITDIKGVTDRAKETINVMGVQADTTIKSINHYTLLQVANINASASVKKHVLSEIGMVEQITKDAIKDSAGRLSKLATRIEKDLKGMH